MSRRPAKNTVAQTPPPQRRSQRRAIAQGITSGKSKWARTGATPQKPTPWRTLLRAVRTTSGNSLRACARELSSSGPVYSCGAPAASPDSRDRICANVHFEFSVLDQREKPPTRFQPLPGRIVQRRLVSRRIAPLEVLHQALAVIAPMRDAGDETVKGGKARKAVCRMLQGDVERRRRSVDRDDDRPDFVLSRYFHSRRPAVLSKTCPSRSDWLHHE